MKASSQPGTATTASSRSNRRVRKTSGGSGGGGGMGQRRHSLDSLRNREWTTDTGGAASESATADPTRSVSSGGLASKSASGVSANKMAARNKSKSLSDRSLQQATRNNTRLNSMYQSCVLELSTQPRSVDVQQLLAAQQEEEEALLLENSGDESDCSSASSSASVDSSSDPIPYREAGAFEEVPLPSSPPKDLLGGATTGATAATAIPVEAAAKVPPPTNAPTNAPETSLIATSPAKKKKTTGGHASPVPRTSRTGTSPIPTPGSPRGVQWHRRISVTRFDYRNAPVEIPLVLEKTVTERRLSLQSSLSPSPAKTKRVAHTSAAVADPSALPIPLRRFSADASQLKRKASLGLSGSLNSLHLSLSPRTSGQPAKPILKRASSVGTFVSHPLNPAAASVSSKKTATNSALVLPKTTVPILRLPTEQELEKMLKSAIIVSTQKQQGASQDAGGSGRNAGNKRVSLDQDAKSMDLVTVDISTTSSPSSAGGESPSLKNKRKKSAGTE